jgi:hypothetical protein
MNIKLLMVGIILITLGATLTATSYFNVNYWQKELIFRRPFVIGANSTSSQYILLDKPVSLKQFQVQIEPGYELQDLLNSTDWSTYQLRVGFNPITVTLVTGHQTMSADIQTSTNNPQRTFYGMIYNPSHVFNIPDDWPIQAPINSSIYVTNPENNSVIWIVEVDRNYLLVNNNWQTAMYLGITSVAVGAVITGISVLIRKPAIKQKETATVE